MSLITKIQEIKEKSNTSQTSNISQTNIPQVDDVSVLVPSDIIDNLNNSELPESFGDQLSNNTKQQVISNISRSTLTRLYQERSDLIQEGINLDKNHATNIQKIEQSSSKVDEFQYQELIKAEQFNYETATVNLKIRKDKNQKDIDNTIKDPFKNQKEETNKRKEARAKAKTKNTKDKTKSKSDRRKGILDNPKKTLIPIMTLLLSDKISEIIAQNDSIKRLVDSTNQIIEIANISNNQIQLNNAKVARDNAIKIIQSNEDKINKITNQIKTITTYVKIFSVIVQILSNIPIPTSVPPGVGIPIKLILKLVQLLDKANRIVLGLSAFLPTIIISLQKAIDILEEYKSQLLTINGLLDTAASTLPDLNSLFNLNFGNLLGEYKGFKFVLKEENNPKFVVRGNKRHYAVAINTQNVEQLKSDYSFTLDPNDLVTQLKLIIDQQNLQG